MSRIASKLAELKITIPPSSAPVANYIPWTRSGNIIFVSGQIARAGNDLVHPGRVGQEVTVEQGQEAAKVCAINILSQLQAAVGNLDKVTRVLKLGVFVAAGPEFTQHPVVA